jgi:1-acyl-sn-glycerol-3-phosphate acyltransferase
MGHQFKWLAKKSLFHVPFFGWAMSVMGYIPLERGKHSSIRDSYRKSLAWLKRGISILIFPEGTRSRSGDIGKFKSGAFRLAIESGRPIIPIVLAGTQNVISKGNAGFGKPGAAYLSILPPVETADLKIREEAKLQEKVETSIRQEFLKRNRILSRRREGQAGANENIDI